MGTMPPVNSCPVCSGLRPLSMHLYELAAYGDFLDNNRITYVRKKNILLPDQEARTSTISGWLRLASQVERVELNTFQFQAAHIYCEPVADALGSDAEHYSRIATSLTRFVFFCNALEETYRFLNPTYEAAYDRAAQSGKIEYLRSPSMQASAVLDQSSGIAIPIEYKHLVENLAKVTDIYLQQTGATLDTSGKTLKDLSYGVQLIRNIRNQVAHGVFPLLENPEYSMNVNNFQIRNTVNLLNQCTRVGAISIQIMLKIDNDGFNSYSYVEAKEDLETGEYFSKHISSGYLMNLHKLQDFGLCEEAYFRWSELALGVKDEN